MEPELISLTSISEQEVRALKTHIRWFFEGYAPTGMKPEYKIYVPISRFEITDLKFEKFHDKIEVTFTLCKPGLLIGKGGSCIEHLAKYLTIAMYFDVEIKIIESKLWS
jgi:ribosomal protein S3